MSARANLAGVPVRIWPPLTTRKEGLTTQNQTSVELENITISGPVRGGRPQTKRENHEILQGVTNRNANSHSDMVGNPFIGCMGAAMMEKHLIKGWCENCNDMVTGKQIDVGIGAYEYWGCKGVDKQIVVVCDECDGELEDVEEITIEYRSRNHEREN